MGLFAITPSIATDKLHLLGLLQVMGQRDLQIEVRGRLAVAASTRGTR